MTKRVYKVLALLVASSAVIYGVAWCNANPRGVSYARTDQAAEIERQVELDR